MFLSAGRFGSTRASDDSDKEEEGTKQVRGRRSCMLWFEGLRRRVDALCVDCGAAVEKT